MVFKVGIVKNYFPKTGYAVIKLNSDISNIDKLIFTDISEDRFGQKNNIFRIEESMISMAKSGQLVMVKVEKPVLKDSFVYKDA